MRIESVVRPADLALCAKGAPLRVGQCRRLWATLLTGPLARRRRFPVVPDP